MFLQKLIVDNKVFLPSTFSQFHAGDRHTHVGIDTKGTPNLRRIDFVALPIGWRHAHVAHSILYDFNTAAKKADRSPAYADVKALFQSQTFTQDQKS